MGLLDRLFGGSSGENEDSSSSISSDVMVCDCCGSTVPETEVEDGRCEECNYGDNPVSFTKYCCGQIYELGEDTCASCGEPL